MRTLIRVAVKSHKLHFIPEFALAALLSSFFCKSKCMEDVGCSKIRTLCCSPPGLNLGCDIGLDGVTAASLTFFFGLAPDFGVASEIHKKYYDHDMIAQGLQGRRNVFEHGEDRLFQNEPFTPLRLFLMKK